MSTIEQGAGAELPAQEGLAVADPGRRRLLIGMCCLAGGLIAVGVGAPAVGMLVGPALQQPPAAWRPVGAASGFAVGSTTLVHFASTASMPWTGESAQTAAWLRRNGEEQFTAFAVNCTHLGCPVRWEAGAELFFCPCHGGTYYADGTVAAGPPPAALRQYPVRVNDGQVEIQAGPLPISTD